MSAKAFLYDDIPDISYGTNNPVFVVGSPRSGTTLLVELIRKYFNINFGTESQFIVPYYKRLSAFGDLSDPQNMHRLIQSLAKERCFGRWKSQFGFSLETDRLNHEIQSPTFRGVLDAIFRQFANYAGRIRWGDKYPAHCLDMPVLEALYPEAQYIHIIRDGRDVGLSLQHVNFGPKNMLQAAKFWKTHVMSAMTFGQNLPQTRFHEVRYESLLKDSVGVMTQLADFLQIKKGFKEVITRIEQQVGDDLLPDNCWKWEKGLSQDQIAEFENGAGDLLKNLGYEVHFPQWKKPSLVKKAVSYLDNVYRCFSHPGYLRHVLETKRAWSHRP